MFDILAGVFWSVTYILAIIHAIKYKMHAIPIFCICSNLGWETVAVIQSLITFDHFSPVILIHIAWFSLDVIIIILSVVHESSWFENFSKKIAILSFYAFSIVAFLFIFQNDGMLISSFVIDLSMAVLFLPFAFRKEMVISPISIAIGIAKLVGDICAWICYRFDSAVNIIGIIVMICNSAYVVILIYMYFNKFKNKNRQEDEL